MGEDGVGAREFAGELSQGGEGLEDAVIDWEYGSALVVRWLGRGGGGRS